MALSWGRLPSSGHGLSSLLGAGAISSCSAGWGQGEIRRSFRRPTGKGLDSEYTLEVWPRGFVLRANVKGEGKRGVECDLQVLPGGGLEELKGCDRETGEQPAPQARQGDHGFPLESVRLSIRQMSLCDPCGPWDGCEFKETALC